MDMIMRAVIMHGFDTFNEFAQNIYYDDLIAINLVISEFLSFEI